jgi:hypothetical protein
VDRAAQGGRARIALSLKSKLRQRRPEFAQMGLIERMNGDVRLL